MSQVAEAPSVSNGKATKQISVPKIQILTLALTLIGDTPLICHRWSEKAKREMLDKQMKKAKKGKEAKSPELDFKESLYQLPYADGTLPPIIKEMRKDEIIFSDEWGENGFGFPAIAFKLAAVRGAKAADYAMTDARSAFHVLSQHKTPDGELVQIHGTPQPREDMVRLQGSTADIRFRGEFEHWYAEVQVRYNANMVSDEQIVNFFNLAGFGTGLGEWRPEKNGIYGCFHVGTQEEVQRLSL